MAKPKSLLFLVLVVLLTHKWTYSSTNQKLSKVALFLLREHISKFTSTIVIAEGSIFPESIDKNNQLLDGILQHLHEKIAVQFFIREYIGHPLEFYLLVVDSLEAFKEFFHLFQNTLFERHFRFLIILTKYTENFRNVMEEIFLFCYKLEVIDVNIIMEHPTEGVSMFTYFLYSETICRRSLPILLYKFNEGLENLQEVFPSKLRNFYGCPFRVSPRIYPPYFTFIGNKKKPRPIGDWDNISGMEGSLLKLLALALNFTIQLKPFQKERSFISQNQSHGCFKQLEDGKVDMAIGGFVDSNDGRWMFSPTGTYHNSPYIFVVRGRNKLSSLRRFAKPFSPGVWMLVMSFLVLTILFTTILKMIKTKAYHFVFGENNRNPVTNFLALFLGYPVIRTPHRNFARYIFLQLLLLTLVLRNAYQGSLYNAFRKGRSFSTPSGYDDLIKWNYTIIRPPEATDLLIFPNERTIKVNSDGYEPRLMMLEKLEGRYVTVVYQDAFLFYFLKNLRYRSELYFIPEVISNRQFVMYLPKHSIYLSVFDKKIKELDAVGIIQKLSKKFTKNEKRLSLYLLLQRKWVSLPNKRLYGLYGICAVLIAISVMVFFLEILSIRYKRLQRILNWIN